MKYRFFTALIVLALAACTAAPKRSRSKLKVNEVDRAGIREVIKGHESEIRGCYEAELDSHPNLQGAIFVAFDIDTGGKVVKAGIDPKKSTLKNAAVHSCLVHAFSGWTFPPPPEKQVVEVSYPLYFSLD